MLLCTLDREAMTTLVTQHQLELDHTRDRLAEEYRTLAREDAAGFEQLIADLQLQLLTAETVGWILLL
jgi:hypothetical protein